jgi:predicted nicotinamide N-methyase
MLLADTTHNEGSEIFIRQDPLNYGLGGKVWEAGSVFAQFLIRFLSDVHFDQLNILELGSGTGLAGIRIAKYLLNLSIPWSITLTDTETLIPLLRENVSSNFPNDPRIECQKLVWGTDPSDWGLDLEKFNVVFGADVVYDERCFNALKETLSAIADRNENALLFIAYVKRRRAEKRFWNIMKKKFKVQTVIINDPDRHLYFNSKLNIIRLVKKD